MKKEIKLILGGKVVLTAALKENNYLCLCRPTKNGFENLSHLEFEKKLKDYAFKSIISSNEKDIHNFRAFYYAFESFKSDIKSSIKRG